MSSTTNLSKGLSFHLRHNKNGGQDEAGWVDIHKLSPEIRTAIPEIIANCTKNRFEWDEKGERIRARQGHSITNVKEDELLQPFKGTTGMTAIHVTRQEAVESILQHGLSRMARNHVHLHLDMKTARKNGVVIQVDIVRAEQLGCKFYMSGNGVLLSPGIGSGLIPAECLKIVQR